MKHSSDKPAPRHLASPAELRREFTLADLDGDGRISFQEFQQLLAGLEAGMSHADMRIGFTEIDTDRDGFVDRQEFIDWWSAD